MSNDVFVDARGLIYLMDRHWANFPHFTDVISRQGSGWSL